MQSTNYNLQNPTSLFEIELRKVRSIFYVPEIISISRLQYHALKVHDMAVYVISDFPHEIFYGDSLLSEGFQELFNNKPEYFIRYNLETRDYSIMINNSGIEYIASLKNFSEIERHKDPQAAINALIRFSSIGDSTSITRNIYDTLIGYIKKENDLNQCILNIIALFGYKETATYQMLIQFILNNEIKIKNDNTLIALIKTSADYTKNKLFDYYIEIFNVIEKYKYFKDDKYNPDINEYIVLKDAIYDICKIFVK